MPAFTKPPPTPPADAVFNSAKFKARGLACVPNCEEDAPNGRDVGTVLRGAIVPSCESGPNLTWYCLRAPKHRICSLASEVSKSWFKTASFCAKNVLSVGKPSCRAQPGKSKASARPAALELEDGQPGSQLPDVLRSNLKRSFRSRNTCQHKSTDNPASVASYGLSATSALLKDTTAATAAHTINAWAMVLTRPRSPNAASPRTRQSSWSPTEHALAPAPSTADASVLSSALTLRGGEVTEAAEESHDGPSELSCFVPPADASTASTPCP
mmetsp:Transcript_120516/g.384808  ORF Transcript_120516/g.384808 Transcript_120516/m.384808 type:complete len:270 (-) Transcript_120516:95-904(-)